MDLEKLIPPKEVVELMQYLGDRCEIVGVRGEFTKSIFERFAGVKNVMVTGYPSTFSRPQAFEKLSQSPTVKPEGRFAYSGTSYRRPAERAMLIGAIKNQDFLIEPQNAENHQYYLDVMTGAEEPRIPTYLSSELESKLITPNEISDYFAKSYRLFRSREAWDEFNDELVSFTYGTRFHVNMASILSSIPALWVTHDSRTREMIDFLHLPSLTLQEASTKSAEELALLTNYSDFFEHIESKFDNFNDYLANFGLIGPKLQL